MNQNKSCAKQLMFDELTNSIVEESIRYWKTMDDVPEHIKDFILNTSGSRVIYDSNTNQYYCSKCLKHLNKQFYCSNCSKQCKIPSDDNSKYIIHSSIENIKEYTEYTKYFVFDIVDDQVSLYIFRVNTCYYNPLMYIPYQTNQIDIEEVYHINKDGLTNILNNDKASFEDYSKKMDENFNYDLLDIFEVQTNNHYLYTDNLHMLQKTQLYKYTFIWELKDFFEKNNFTLSSLTYYPIWCKEFEYLVKMKLYRLATTCADAIKFNKNFKETFGIDKKYYSFMKDNDICYSQLIALKLCPTTDIDLINFISADTYIFSKLSKYVRANKVKLYFDNQKLNYNNIFEYYDYISCCEKMALNIKSKQILFPKDFIKQYNKLFSEKIITTDSKINERIKELSDILQLNKYEDEQYIIFPADSVESLIDESNQMANCVRNYSLDVSNNKCQIYFMRYKKTPNKSLVTVEVQNGKIVQARARFNEVPTKDIDRILRKWENNIIPIINSEL